MRVAQDDPGVHLGGVDADVEPGSEALEADPECGVNPPPAGPRIAGPGSVRLSAPLASFGPRSVSFLIDTVAPVIVLNLVLSVAAVTGGVAWRGLLAAAGAVALVAFGIWNSGYLQGTTGGSLGRRVARTRLVGITTGRPVGFGKAVARQVCHLLELGVGFLWPLWDGNCQTFADKIVKSVVVRTGELTEDHPRLTV